MDGYPLDGYEAWNGKIIGHCERGPRPGQVRSQTQATSDQTVFRLWSLIRPCQTEMTSDQTFVRPKKLCDLDAIKAISDQTRRDPSTL